MKTYKRKRQEHQEIEGVEELCRLCLEKEEEGIPIFNDGQDVCAAVAMRIMICVGLDMKHEHSLPNKICSKCYEELEKYYKFRKKCELSYQKLKSHVLALKSKHPMELTEPPVGDSKQLGEDCPCEEKELVIEEKETEEELKTEQSPKVNESSAGKVVVMEELHIPMQTEVAPDVGTLLTTVLTELGILGAEEGGLVLRDEGITHFELEMGDGEQLMLEFVEEDDVVVPGQEKIQSQKIAVLKKEAALVDGKPKPKNHKRRSKMPGPWCSVCGRVFSSTSAASRHMAGHGGARPHACPTCHRAFTQKSVLERHMLVHREVRPHACTQCNKSFNQRAALVAHARTHAGAAGRALRLHRCAACDKVFLYASGLSRHMVAHSGREFPCGACHKTFKDRSSLRRHVDNFSHDISTELAPS